MFKFYFDNNLVSNPVNWQDFKETIEWDDTIKGILPKYELKLTFTGGGYKYLYDLKVSAGYCNMVEFRVEQSDDGETFFTVLNGYISISRCIFNLNKHTVDCDIIDDNYGAMIFNNKSIKTSFSDRSKNGKIINAPASTLLVPFVCTSGVYGSLGDARNAISVFQAFKYLVSWMSDGRMGFESNFLADTENVGCILTGHQLRIVGSEKYPIITFQKLFQEIDRKKNIGFTVVDRSGVKTLKIENIDYFYSTDSGVFLNNIQDLQESFNPEKLYSGVKLGGTIASFDPLIHNFIPRQFIGFDTEEYGFTGICNIDKQLDLGCDWLCDTNIIEELTVTNTTNTSYDTDVFLVKGTYSGGYYYADKIALTSGGYMYNKVFTNEYSSQAFKIYGDTILYTGLVSNNFRAERTDYDETNPTGANFPHAPTGHADVTHNDLDPTYKTTTVFQIYNDDSTPPNNNIGGNYDNSNGRYTAPLDGSYFFNMYSIVRIFSEFEVLGTQGVPRYTRFTLTLNQYDSGGGLKDTFSARFPDHYGTVYDPSPPPNFTMRYSGYYAFENSAYINCIAGDYIITSVTVESVAQSFGDWLWCNITNSSVFQSIATPSGGGVFQEGDTGEYFVSKFQFDYPVSNETYDIVKADLTKSLSISHDNNIVSKGWLRKTERNYQTGEMNIELISNKTNTNASNT